MIATEVSASPKEHTRGCPLCMGSAVGLAFPYQTTWQGRHFKYMRCGQCGCVFVDPVPTSDTLELMYSAEHYHETFHETKHGQRRAHRSVALLLEHCGERRKVLDFGCGGGDFLLAAKSGGFECEGAEFDPSAVARAAKTTGVPVSNVDSLRERQDQFDIIHLGDVFEHLSSPYDTIVSLRRLLRPHGVFFVEGPLERNPSLVYYAAIGVKWFKQVLRLRHVNSMPPWHLILVDRHAQEAFFTERMGYKRLLFTVYEDGWPYCTDQPRPITVGNAVRTTIGTCAILVGRMTVGGKMQIGNRFAALFDVGAM